MQWIVAQRAALLRVGGIVDDETQDVWKIYARRLSRFWGRGSSGVWRVDHGAEELGMIYFASYPEYGEAQITGFRLAALTRGQEARAMRLVADFVQDELGFFPDVRTFCDDLRARETARASGVAWREIPLLTDDDPVFAWK